MLLTDYSTEKNILVIAAHPDDEVLGCGGTIARYTHKGCNVYVIFMTDGVSSRKESSNHNDIKDREESTIIASQILGFKLVEVFGFPDNGMDKIPLLDIVKKLENVINEIKPTVVYTHHWGDLNIDHRITCEAVLTACRPYPGQIVKEIYGFEISSSTEWSSPSVENSFIPNNFVDISKTLNLKIKALRAYIQEMRNFPHSRSLEAISSLVKFRGATIGVNAAECFTVIRQSV